jgi:hypothetical protein
LLGDGVGLLNKYVNFYLGVMMQQAKQRLVLNGIANHIGVDRIWLLQQRHQCSDVLELERRYYVDVLCVSPLPVDRACY